MRRTAILTAIIFMTIYSPGLQGQTRYERNFHQDMPIIQAGLSLCSLGLHLRSQIEPLDTLILDKVSSESVFMVDRPATLQWSPTAARISDIFLLSEILLPLGLLSDTIYREDFSDLSTLYFESLLLNIAGTLVTKSLVKRPRPYIFNQNAPVEKRISLESRQSFFSGHTSIAFASAMFLSMVLETYHPNSEFAPWIKIGSFSSAALIGYLRIKAGEHYLTDVLTGAIFGSMVSYLVLKSHEQTGYNLDQIDSLESKFCRLNVTITF